MTDRSIESICKSVALDFLVLSLLFTYISLNKRSNFQVVCYFWLKNGNFVAFWVILIIRSGSWEKDFSNEGVNDEEENSD